jgi:hypothetical protein
LRPANEGELVKVTLRCTRAARIQVGGQNVEVTPATKDILVAPGDPLLRIEWSEDDHDAIAFTSFELVAGA